MKPIALLTPALILVGCAATQQSALLTAAKPIATTALTAAAARYGVSPATTQMVIDSLYGAAVQAQAGQPVSAGAATPEIGQAIASATPTGTPNNQAALLQAAAASLKP